jgi:hypothetical protein
LSDTKIQKAQEIAETHNGTCLSEIVEDSRGAFIWKCHSGHEFKARIYDVLNGRWCKECSAIKKQVELVERCNRLANKKGGTFLSRNITKQKDRSKWKCKEGHIWETRLSNIFEGRWCKKCSDNSRRDSIEKCHLLAEKKGGRCLSTEYVNTDTHLEWECDKKHKWFSAPSKIKNDRWCPYCVGRHKTIEYYQELAESRGGKCISNKYVGVHSPLKWMCDQGHTWDARPSNIDHLDTWCPFCQGKYQTIENMKVLAESRGGKCLSDVYIKNNSKLEWKCNDGHNWKATPNSIKSGSWCPKCKINYGEEIIRQYFEQAFMKPFPNTRPDWLEGLELDGYNESLKLAFEHHGTQHYKFSKRFHITQEGFKAQLDRDEMTRILCIKKGVTLIEVPYIPTMIKLNEVPEYLNSKLNILNINPINSFNDITIDFNSIYSQSQLIKLSQIVKSKKGKLLTQVYKGDRGHLLVECNKGHQWTVTPNALKRGHWCPHCYGNTKKDISEIHDIAKSRGFVLLSDEYRGSLSPLSWQCQKGHVWKATPSHIDGGTGCPKCSGTYVDLEDVETFAVKNKLQLISVEYLNNMEPLEFLCLEGHSFEITWSTRNRNINNICPDCRDIADKNTKYTKLNDIIISKKGILVSHKYEFHDKEVHIRCENGHDWHVKPKTITSGHWCPFCLGKHKTKKDMDNLATSKNFTFLSPDYIGNEVKLKWKCDKGHILDYSAHSFGKLKKCPFCSGRRVTIDDIKKYASDNHIQLLTTKYINNQQPLEFICKMGHKFIKKWASKYKHKGEICPKCKKLNP